jgi:hypothetical protein
MAESIRSIAVATMPAVAQVRPHDLGHVLADASDGFPLINEDDLVRSV